VPKNPVAFSAAFVGLGAWALSLVVKNKCPKFEGGNPLANTLDAFAGFCFRVAFVSIAYSGL
jgi:hypothetical protein